MTQSARTGGPAEEPHAPPVGGLESRAFRLAPNELIDLYHGRLRVLFHDERIAPDPDGRRIALARFLGCCSSPGF